MTSGDAGGEQDLRDGDAGGAEADHEDLEVLRCCGR